MSIYAHNKYHSLKLWEYRNFFLPDIRNWFSFTQDTISINKTKLYSNYIDSCRSLSLKLHRELSSTHISLLLHASYIYIYIHILYTVSDHYWHTRYVQVKLIKLNTKFLYFIIISYLELLIKEDWCMTVRNLNVSIFFNN